jgi:non-ribosomal peptide synthetase component F
MVISAEEYSQLEKAAQQHAVTFNMLSLAAVYILLHLYTGKKRLGVWGNFANRPHSKFEGTIGWFATSHLLSVEFAGDSRIADVLSRVRTAVLEASAHQMLPNGVLFARVLQNSGKRDRLRNARGPEHIVVEVVHEEWLAQPAELKLEPGLVPNSRIAEFPLYLLGLVRRNELVITARYSATRFDPAAVRSLLRDLHVVLKKMVSEPQAPVSAIVLRTLFETAHVS